MRPVSQRCSIQLAEREAVRRRVVPVGQEGLEASTRVTELKEMMVATPMNLVSYLENEDTRQKNTAVEVHKRRGAEAPRARAKVQV